MKFSILQLKKSLYIAWASFCNGELGGLVVRASGTG